MQEESQRYLRVGVLQYDDLGSPAFMHRTERTKFANWGNGYPLELMRPQLIVPSYGPDIPLQVRTCFILADHTRPSSKVDGKRDHI